MMEAEAPGRGPTRGRGRGARKCDNQQNERGRRRGGSGMTGRGMGSEGGEGAMPVDPSFPCVKILFSYFLECCSVTTLSVFLARRSHENVSYLLLFEQSLRPYGSKGIGIKK
jgi:hypothetical protein